MPYFKCLLLKLHILVAAQIGGSNILVAAQIVGSNILVAAQIGGLAQCD